ncbi:phosphatase PAP2 family protein [Pseudomonas citronellolis]|uniref:phosphatase PAP2 family protein n=1 Tax=Pseudomonas citronellolis TaxID=53408 RepID=UPI0023E3ADFE|nr:phosphatase PAP2 family protein [Pseudomonas citronellolis]MDF3937120.1 phosphatase PAP2 family protein [Pseudomonas citronellolis]
MSWHLITRLGDSALLLPCALFIYAWLLARRALPDAQRWLLLFGLAAGATLASKLAFMGWGVAIPAWDYTGLSGHSMLAGAVLPVLGSLLAPPGRPRWRIAAAAGGALLAVLVGVSRLEIRVHSPAEVYAGLGAGMAASAAFLCMGRKRLPALSPLLLTVVLLLGSLQALSGVRAPTHQVLERIATYLADRDAPFKRGYWNLPPAA